MPTEWTFEGKTITPEKWRWVAIYPDGEVLKQFDDSGRFHQFREIDQSRLVAFSMVCEDCPVKFTIQFEPGMKLIHFYENTIQKSMSSGKERRIRIPCFGYERNGETVLHMIVGNELVTTNDTSKVKVL